MRTLPFERFSDRLPEMLALIQELVECESPSTEKALVDRLGERILRELEDLGGVLRVANQANTGNHLIYHWGEGTGGILVLAHMDTVFEAGALARLPYRQADGRLYGAGVLDMKSSIAMLLTILRLFHEQGTWPRRPVTVLFTSDEEIGSLTSRALIEAEARRAGVAFCLEPALASGALKTARKGTGDIELLARGVAAHAGVDHEKGRNAIEELAHHILAAQRLTDYTRGTTVNVGVVRGGTRGNVVPDEAYALLDFRVTTMEEFRRLEQWARGLTPRLDGTQVSAQVELNRPPMPRDETMAAAFQKAREIARGLGLELSEGSTGGGSDANFVAPLGVPVLDGLGPVGDGAHSEREFVRVESLVERSALLAALMLNW